MLREVRFQNGFIYIMIAEGKELKIEMTDKMLDDLYDIVSESYGLNKD